MYSKFLLSLQPIRDELIRIKLDYNRKNSTTDAHLIDKTNDESNVMIDKDTSEDLLQVTTVHTAHQDAVMQGEREHNQAISELKAEIETIREQMTRIKRDRNEDMQYLIEEITKLKTRQTRHENTQRDQNESSEIHNERYDLQADKEQQILGINRLLDNPTVFRPPSSTPRDDTENARTMGPDEMDLMSLQARVH